MTTRFSALMLALLCTAALFSCKKENDDTYNGNATQAYFPLQLGKYVVYNVDSTIWDDFSCLKKTNSYQMRYVVADTFRDNAFRMGYRIETFIRKKDTDPWQNHRVIYATATESRLEYHEENLKFIKLIYPVENGRTWDGNALLNTNDQDLQYFTGWTYAYQNVGQAYNNGEIEFDNTVTVTQTDETQNDPEAQPTAFAYRTYSKEVYGYGIGMVYKETYHWTYDPAVAQCRKGLGVIMRAVDHN